MKITAALFLIAGFTTFAIMMPTPGKSSGARSYTSAPGIYEGEGMFHMAGRRDSIQGKLEIRADGTFTFDHTMAGAGPESGTWVRKGQDFVMSAKTTADGKDLRKAMQSNLPDRKWHMLPGYTEVHFEDGTMNFRLIRKS